MSFILRKAEIGDIPKIAKMHVETWQSHYRGQVPDDYLNRLSVEKRIERWNSILGHPKPKTVTFVAAQEDEIVGFCSVGPSEEGSASANLGEVYAIYIAPSKQGQGIGSALMHAGLDHLKREGFSKAILWVLKTNNPSIGFYLSKGWKADGGERKDKKDGFTFEDIRYTIDL